MPIPVNRMQARGLLHNVFRSSWCSRPGCNLPTLWSGRPGCFLRAELTNASETLAPQRKALQSSGFGDGGEIGPRQGAVARLGSDVLQDRAR